MKNTKKPKQKNKVKQTKKSKKGDSNACIKAQITAAATQAFQPATALMATRQAQLEQIAAELKQELFGIDDIIDQVVHAIRAWYVWPEVITRPVIVSLWGLTGTGKTQLVRSLAQKIGFYSRFVEVQMDGFSHGNRYGHNTISSILGDSDILEGEPGVLLLDEFQRYRTIDNKNQDIKVERYQDVWTLLSDGKLSPKLSFLSNLEYKLADMSYDRANESNSEKKRQQKKTFKLDAWDARDLKNALKLKEPLLEIMRWSADEVRLRVEQLHQSESHWETDYSRLLIFVTGNLDEMYSDLAERVEDCDTDADVFHQMTRKLSMIDVKKALTQRFRPEQIARLGNCHVIYPSLSKASYQKLIARTCEGYMREVEASAGMSFVLSDEVLDEMYQNGVFPAQGTRPVFSTVHNILSSTLVNAALWALENTDITDTEATATRTTKATIKIGLDAQRKHFVVRHGRRRHTLPAHFEINGLRRKNSRDFRALLAVHEAGHGLVYGMLMQCPPQEIRINVVSFEGGYNSYAQHKAYSRRVWLDCICVSLAGRVAESWVFGEDAVTTGAYEDYRKATSHAAKFIRHFGFGERISHTDVCTDMNENVNTHVEPTNAQIEALLQTQYARAARLLEEHAGVFKQLVQYLLEHGAIPPEVFAEMAGLAHEKPIDNAIEPYHAAWEVFASQ